MEQAEVTPLFASNTGENESQTMEEQGDGKIQEMQESSRQGAEEDAADGREEERLRARIRELEQQISDSQILSERVSRECVEFERYFPDVSLRHVPEEVWGQVHTGVPLSAAYALYEKKQEQQKAVIEQRSAKNAAFSSGTLDSAGQEYFSPAQVRAMSRSEVRENYDRIFESMRYWQ